MLRGFYTAASGILTQEKKLNAFANNISNVSTVGYKKENLVAGTFGEHIAVRMNAYQQTSNNNIGKGVWMQVIDEQVSDHSQGGFEATSRPLDMSIMGEGFFLVNNEGEEYLTRDGQFSLDEEGYLILPGYGRVQGEGGDIQAGYSDIRVDGSGNILVREPGASESEYETLDKLMIVTPDDYTTLRKSDSRLFQTDGYTQVTPEVDSTVRQMQLERSNVNLAEEMSRIIASQRSLQSCSQIVKMYDEMSDKMNTQVSRT